MENFSAGIAVWNDQKQSLQAEDSEILWPPHVSKTEKDSQGTNIY